METTQKAAGRQARGKRLAGAASAVCLVVALVLGGLLAAAPTLARRRPQPTFQFSSLDAYDRTRCGRRLLHEARRPTAGAPDWRLRALAAKCKRGRGFTAECALASALRKAGGRALDWQLQDQRVVAGFTAYAGQFPWFVAVQIDFIGSSETATCGGILVHPTLVLTAAHCITDIHGRPPAKLVVLAGFSDWNDQTNVQAVRANATERDPRYEPASNPFSFYGYDLSVVRLERPVRYDEYAQPACLPVAGEPVRDSPHCTMPGVGMWKPDQLPSQLQAIPLRRIECPVYRLDETCFFTSDSERWPGRSCRGDSGSGVYCSLAAGDAAAGELFVAVALASWGPAGPCKRHSEEAVYYSDLEIMLPALEALVTKIMST